jgi:Domain of unknown function (DUF929)
MSNPATKSSSKARPRTSSPGHTTSKNTHQTKKNTSKGTAARGNQTRGRQTPPSTPASFRSRHPVLTALVPVVLIVAVVGTMVVIKATGNSGSGSNASHVASGGTSATADPGTIALPASVTAALKVPTATLDQVGASSAAVPPTKINGGGAALRSADGKLEVTYVGAEYCPYCAAERWALAVALSRYGTFSNLAGTHSASDDVYPNTQTLSFYGSTYSSSYVNFRSVEEATNQRNGATYGSLQSPTAAETAQMNRYDSQGSIPFIDIGNKYVVVGASFSPQVLQGLSKDQIAAQLSDPSSPVAQAIDGAANDITGAISSLGGPQPSGVANSAAVAAIAKKLGG